MTLTSMQNEGAAVPVQSMGTALAPAATSNDDLSVVNIAVTLTHVSKRYGRDRSSSTTSR